MVGMRDVAREAGASLSTVSLVVNGNGYVSRDMRTRIERAMATLHYVPNELARNLFRDRTDIIGMIIPTIRHPFFATLTAAVQRVLSAQGFRTLLCSTVDAKEGEAEYVDMLQRHMMDGIIMASHTEHDVNYWESIARPVVAFDRYLGPGIPAIGSDHEQGGAMEARLLLRTGARHVVMIGGPRIQFHDLARADDSEQGGEAGTTFPTVRHYLRLEYELSRAGIRYDYLEAGEVDDFDGYAKAAHEVFERFDDVDAIVSSDIGGACCVQEALGRGINVPRDLQIIAYDGSYITRVAGMQLTAVHQNFQGIADVLCRRMIDAIEDEPSARGEAGKGSDARGPLSSGASGAQGDLIPVNMVVGQTTR